MPWNCRSDRVRVLARRFPDAAEAERAACPAAAFAVSLKASLDPANHDAREMRPVDLGLRPGGHLYPAPRPHAGAGYLRAQ
jgi:hypothetical protein